MKRRTFIFGTLVVLAGAVISISLLLPRHEKKIEIDLAKNIVIEYTGVNGEGYAEVRDNDIENIDNASDEMTEFFLSLDYDIKPNGLLENYEEITVTVDYPKDVADKLNLKVINNEKKFIVKGLKEAEPEQQAVGPGGANDDWIQGNCIDETHRKEKEFLLEEYGLPSITFKYAQEYGNDSSQLYKIRPVMKDSGECIGYKVIFKEE